MKEAKSLAEIIRRFVFKAYLEPAMKAGDSEVVVIARDVHRHLRMRNKMPAICAALDARGFREDYGLLLEERTGPKNSSTVTWKFIFKHH